LKNIYKSCFILHIEQK